MNWTIQNVSLDTIATTDTPIPLTWVAGQILLVPITYVTGSAQIAQAIQNQQLCVVAYGAATPQRAWGPLTYVIQGTAGTGALAPVALTQSGASPPLTTGLWTTGTLLVNVVTLATDSSLTLALQAWDGAVYYPAQSLGSAITTVGAQLLVAAPPPIAGRLTWTVTGSGSWTLLYQLA